ncbi:hypothetical protein DFJ77DRAFT_442888 [Powellomyces hirtus]|nr:hypothetical protein DFJ77DRAFT_442888 [Powellomyces hirtus]
MLLDLGLYFLLARKLKRQDRILYPNRQDSSFSRAFKGTQLLRIFLFFLIEVMCCYLAVRSRFGVVVQMTFTVVCVTRPFIVLTDMRRVQLIQDASSHRSTTKAADASKRILVERTQDLEESKALAPPSNALLPPADIEIANKMPPERQDEACK